MFPNCLIDWFFLVSLSLSLSQGREKGISSVCGICAPVSYIRSPASSAKVSCRLGWLTQRPSSSFQGASLTDCLIESWELRIEGVSSCKDIQCINCQRTKLLACLLCIRIASSNNILRQQYFATRNKTCAYLFIVNDNFIFQSIQMCYVIPKQI